MTMRYLAPCLGAALLGGAAVQWFHPRRVDAAPVVQNETAPGVVVEPIFWRNNCQFYRVTDSHGVHYAATGYFHAEVGSGHAAISCVIAP